MKYLKKIIYALIILFLLSCSSNEDGTITNNGFKVNGKFYATDFASASCCSPYILIFSSDSDSNIGQFGRFDLLPEVGLNNNTPLSPGTYTFKNFGIYKGHAVQFHDTTLPDSTILAYTSSGSNGIKSGTVTVNSVSNDGHQIIEINLDYKFVWEDRTVIGHYSGPVTPS